MKSGLFDASFEYSHCLHDETSNAVKCYKVLDAIYTQEDASVACEDEDSHLARFVEVEHLQEVASSIRSSKSGSPLLLRPSHSASSVTVLGFLSCSPFRFLG